MKGKLVCIKLDQQAIRDSKFLSKAWGGTQTPGTIRNALRIAADVMADTQRRLNEEKRAAEKEGEVITYTPKTLDQLSSINYLDRITWSGKLWAIDATPTHDFTRDDVEHVAFCGSTEPEDWDGSVAAILKLKDGRWASWETSWGPTGDGFCEDAYGGDADVLLSSSLEDAITHGLTPKGRELCGIPVGMPEKDTRECPLDDSGRPL